LRGDISSSFRQKISQIPIRFPFKVVGLKRARLVSVENTEDV
jgi:hypothetical protein